MEKFTKGPWEYSPHNNWLCSVLTSSDAHIVTIENTDIEGFDEMYANAQLIAAAPDLYKALKACVNTFAPLMAKDSPAIAEIRSILLKANPHYNP